MKRLWAAFVEFFTGHCPHVGARPAVTSRGMASYCPHCHCVAQLSPEEFFACFGEAGAEYVAAWRGRSQ